MKRLLIIGASILQLPAIKRAKEMGYYVGVIDYNPTAVGISFADEYFNVSTIDVDGVSKVAENFRPDGIMTLATDMPMRSISVACEKNGLPGISRDTAIKSTDKGEMIRAFEANGVEHPWYYILSSVEEVEDILDCISYPCISKPTDNSGSRGVVQIQTSANLRDALAYSASNGRCGNVILEEYLIGSEVSVEIMAVDGIPHVLAVTDKLTTGAPHFVEMGHSQPSNLSAVDVEKISDLACRAVAAVGIKDGPAHVEIILTDKGPRMVELGARMGGDCITTHLVPLSTGIDMVEATIRCACGEKPDLSRRLFKGSAIRYFNAPAGTITSIEGEDIARTIEGVQEICFVKKIGDVIEDLGSSSDRIGFVIAQANTANEAILICEKVCEIVRIEVK